MNAHRATAARMRAASGALPPFNGADFGEGGGFGYGGDDGGPGEDGEEEFDGEDDEDLEEEDEEDDMPRKLLFRRTTFTSQFHTSFYGITVFN